MLHSSKIKDADAFFEVDAITRQIINKTPQKITLIQYDHNSERFTFALPRHIEGHDMAESAKAEVHFINIETSGANSHADKYEMNDLQPDPNDESKVICSWLISNNATQYAGRLAFMIRFACVDDNNNYVYVWNTATNEEISITNGMDNGAAMVDNYPDILAQWRQDVLSQNAYITDFFKQLPEGKTINDLDDAYEHGCVYLLSKNNSQTGRSDTLEVTGGWYYDEEFGGDLATTFQIKTEHNGFEYSIMQRYWKDGKWTDWQDVFATPQYVNEQIAKMPTLKRLATVVTTEECTQITVDGLNIKSGVVTVLMTTSGETKAGCSLGINGKIAGGYAGDPKAGVYFLIWKENGTYKAKGKVGAGYNNYNFSTVSGDITSITVENPYKNADGSYATGTKVTIFEGVYPNGIGQP